MITLGRLKVSDFQDQFKCKKCKAGVECERAHLNKSLNELNSLPPGSSGVFVVQRLDLLWDFSEPCLQVLCERQILEGLRDSVSYNTLICSKRLKHSPNNPRQSNKYIKHIFFNVDNCWPFFRSPFFSTLVRGLTPEKTSASSIILSDPSIL